jgi:hypothetical protein
MSFFEAYARLLEPCFERDKANGDFDFYGSPLQHLGFTPTQAYQIDPIIMRLESESITLARMAIIKDIMNDKNGYVPPLAEQRLYLSFKQRLSAILFSEASLRIFSNVNSSLHPDFFIGVTDYFKSEKKEDKKDTEDEDTGTDTNMHKPRAEVYDHLLKYALTLIWAEYKNRGLNLPIVPKLDSDTFEAIDEKNKGSIKTQLLLTYRRLFDYYCAQPIKGISLTEKFLNDNLKYCLNLSSEKPTNCVFRKKTNKSVFIEAYEDFSVCHRDKPWRNFFQHIKQGDTLNFAQAKPYAFYKKHGRTNFWLTLLLLDLHQHLQDNSQEGNWITELSPLTASDNTMQQPPSDADIDPTSAYLAELTTAADDDDLSLPGEMFAYARRNSPVNRNANTRFFDGRLAEPKEPTIGPKQQENFYSLKPHKGEIVINENMITLTIPERVLNATESEFMFLSLYVFYYRDNQRVSIPCEIIEEDIQEDKAVLKIELDEFVINALGFEPIRTHCLSAFSCKEGTEDIVIAFLSEDFYSKLNNGELST